MIKTFTLSLIAACSLALAARAQDDQPEPLVADGGFGAAPLADCHTDLRYLNQVSGWQNYWPREWQAIAEAGATKDDLARWSAAPDAIAAATEKLREGVAAKETAPRPVVSRVEQQLRDLSAALEARDARYFTKADDSDWNALLTDKILPAVSSFETYLENEYYRKARKKPGLTVLNDEGACFMNAAKEWTTLSLSPEEIEAIGERVLTETKADLSATGEPGERLDDIMARLREEQKTDPTTADELIAISQAALDRAQEKTLTAFSKKAKGPIVVAVMPEHIQASFPAGYYQTPVGDAPAQYVINPSRPGERRLMAEVIAFHEGVPGHHLFFDYPRDTPSSGYNSGILEGWALYSEYVADEMGLFSSTFDRQGMMAKHLWSASRLVVEPGLHLHGWSRKKAIDFMLENTLLPRPEIEIEVDRYIAMPGQSLSYTLGANLLMTERERAREKMGDKFDIAAFHDVVLAPGVRPLPQVRDDIRKWAGEG